MDTKYIVLKEGKDILNTEAYGPFSVEELHNFLKKVQNTSLTILPLREVTNYAD